jgi:uncharacterized repeat protein (TIGR02543 family)
MMLLMMLLTATTAGAADVTTNITYDGVAASDVTVSVTYTGQSTGYPTEHETLSNNVNRFYPLDNTVVTIAVTSSQSISTEFSATYVFFGQNQQLAVNTDGNNCTFTPDPDNNTTLNITVRPAGGQVYYVHYSTGDEFGVSGSMADQTFYVGVPQTLSPCGFTRADNFNSYSFLGWATTDGGPVVYSDGQEVTDIASADQTITLYATWQQVQTFTVHFDANGGTGTMADQTFTLYEVKNLTANAFTRTGYRFTGWNTEADGSGEAYYDQQNITPFVSLTLYAQWTALPPNSYFVHFDANGGEGAIADQTFTVGEAQALTANAFTPPVPLYVFLGWNTKANGSGVSYSNGQVVTDIAAEYETITLYAQWQDFNPDHILGHTVHYDANGGEGTMADQSITQGLPQTLSPCGFTRTGYSFTGWNTKADGSGTAYNDQQNITRSGDLTLYAQWELEDDLAVNGNTYTINTTKGWNQFCDLLEGGTSFTDKTVKLNNDISVTRMAGSSSHKFTGTFNGKGNTLTVNYGTSDSPITEQYAAPLRYMDGGSIENLHVTGNIYTSAKYAAGFVSNQFGTVAIRNCISSVNIQSSVSGDGTHGGFVAANNSNATLTIEGCVFDGSLLSTGTTATHSCGGFVGWRSNSGTVNISNSLFAPAASVTIDGTSGSYPSRTFVRNDATNVNITNSYYTAVLGTAQGKQAYEVSAAPERLCNGTGEGIVKTYSNNGLNYGLGFDNKYYLGIIPLSDSETEGVTYLTTNLQGKTVPAEFKREFTAGKASTICLPFAMNTISGGKVYRFAGITHDSTNGWVATMSDATPDGNKVTSTEANMPYVFMPDATGEVTFSGVTDVIPASLTAGSTASGDWTFKGTYTKLIYGTAPFEGYVYGFASKTKTVGDEGEVQAGEFVHAKDGASVPPMRCYLTYKNGSQFAGNRGGMTRADEDLPQTITVRFVSSRGEVTAIGTLNTQTGEIVTDGWYTLSGTRLNGKPSKRGIYINNGRKIVIK